MEKLLKKTGWMSIIESIIFVILGIILVCKPEGTIRMVSIVLGTILILVGIGKIISYIVLKGKNDFYNYDLIYGLTSIVIGFIVMRYINTITSIIRIIIGIWIVYTSFVRMNLALQLKKLDTKVWIGSLVLAVLMFICGMYIILNADAIIVTLGIIMIIYSVIDVIENVIFMKNVKRILE